MKPNLHLMPEEKGLMTHLLPRAQAMADRLAGWLAGWLEALLTSLLAGVMPVLGPILLPVLLNVLLGQSPPCRAQTGSADEYAIRAAMLLNLAIFIEWPAVKLDASHPQFVVCILGVDPIGLYADRFLATQVVVGKPVHIAHLENLDTAGSCHILYVGAAEMKKQNRALPEVMKAGVLTISEQANAPGLNQVIGLPAMDDHVQIQVDLGRAQRSGLIISSKLLHLATVTH